MIIAQMIFITVIPIIIFVTVFSVYDVLTGGHEHRRVVQKYDPSQSSDSSYSYSSDSYSDSCHSDGGGSCD